MAFADAHNFNLSHGIFNDVGQNQYTYNIQLASLESASSTASIISSLVQEVEGSRKQLQALGTCIDTLLTTLDSEFRAGRLSAANTSTALENLNELLDNICTFVQNETATEFMKSLSQKDSRIAKITAYYHQLDVCIASLQLSSLINVHDWQKRNDEARLKDQRALHDRLNDLESNQSHLKELLSRQHHSLEAMMVSLKRTVEEHSGGDRELRFFSRCVRHLSAMTGRQMRLESWMITSFDVELGLEIGSGGYARVFEATWHKTRVAVKVLKSDDGVTPSPESIIREISTWSRLSHPHVLQFLGANVLDNKPFIVTPLMVNGNARVYIRSHPNFDRLTMMYHIALGIMYLHSQNIVHGDLKGQNVLIDDSGKALLCDFGLSRVKADITSRTTTSDATTVAGSRYWMAPERLMGKPLRNPGDIYAFGMTSYEIYTDEVPLGHITPAELRELVVHQHVRPERPDDDQASQLTDEVWQLVEHCWVHDPLKRPTVDAICDDIHSILQSSKIPLQGSPEHYEANETGPGRQDTYNEELAEYRQVPSNDLLENSIPPSLTTTSQPQSSPASEITHLASFGGSPDRGGPLALQPQDADHQNPSTSATIANILTDSHPVQLEQEEHGGDRELEQEKQQTSHDADSVPPSQGTSVKTLARNPTLSRNPSHVADVPPEPPRISRASTAAAQWERDRQQRQRQQQHLVWERLELESRLSARSKDSIICVVCSRDGNKRVSATSDGRMQLYNVDPKTGEVIDIGPALEGHTGILRIVFSPDGKKLASASHDGIVRLWDVDTGQTIGSALKGHTSMIHHLVFSPDGKKLASTSYNERVQLWDASTGEAIGSLKGQVEAVFHVVFSDDGNKLALLLFDGMVQIWDIGRAVTSAFMCLPTGVGHIRYFRNGKLIVTSGLALSERLLLSFYCVVEPAYTLRIEPGISSVHWDI